MADDSAGSRWQGVSENFLSVALPRGKPVQESGVSAGACHSGWRTRPLHCALARRGLSAGEMPLIRAFALSRIGTDRLGNYDAIDQITTGEAAPSILIDTPVR